jgi:hypothetical protein
LCSLALALIRPGSVPASGVAGSGCELLPAVPAFDRVLGLER